MCVCIYVHIYLYILNNDSAGAYQHYGSYKKEGHDVYGKGNRLAIQGAKQSQSASAESPSSGEDARLSFLFLDGVISHICRGTHVSK